MVVNHIVSRATMIEIECGDVICVTILWDGFDIMECGVI